MENNVCRRRNLCSNEHTHAHTHKHTSLPAHQSLKGRGNSKSYGWEAEDPEEKSRRKMEQGTFTNWCKIWRASISRDFDETFWGIEGPLQLVRVSEGAIKPTPISVTDDRPAPSTLQNDRKRCQGSGQAPPDLVC